jgi:hypothetical protein
MNKKLIEPIFTDSEIKQIALLMAANCVRNTVIEDYHARGSLSQSDMKVFNKEVSNKLYTFLRFFFKGSAREREALLEVTGLFYPSDWDQPVLDESINKSVKLLLKKPGMISEVMRTNK